jgi:NAD(P)-dependent dehydrogenase (short-subunit alcohol dehydrogenase family)
VNSGLLIEKGNLQKDCLAGKTVLITGAGGGIGLEAVRSLLWLGARVVVAEVDREKCKNAERQIDGEFGTGHAAFFPTDIANEKDIGRLEAFIRKEYGCLDVLFNNATAVAIGSVHTVGIKNWDKSYEVNLRSAVLLLERFLPDMLKRDSGVVVFVPSSGAAPYMGAYEVMKTAQVELCNTLAAELEGTNVVAFSIGPGLVRTDTAVKSIEIIAGNMGMTTEAFFEMNKQHILDPHTAGTGFAAAVAMAEKYNGKEIASMQALIDAGIVFEAEAEKSAAAPDAKNAEKALALLHRICETYGEQYRGWQERNVFERQWIARDFKKETGISYDYMSSGLKDILASAEAGDWQAAGSGLNLFHDLEKYYLHQVELLEGYEKDIKKKEEYKAVMDGWIEDLREFLGMIG